MLEECFSNDHDAIFKPLDKWYCVMEYFANTTELEAYIEGNISRLSNESLTNLVRVALKSRDKYTDNSNEEIATIREWNYMG